jgi:hypothetical protein
MGLPKEIAKFMADHDVTADELWAVRPGTYAIKHKALERVRAQRGITFGPPMWLKIEPETKTAIVQVTGKLGDRTEWSTGEAAPYNNKNTYPVAMAEKRAKDRVTLQLLNAYGSIYSEEEADDFKQKRANPHVTTPDDVSDAVLEYDDNGQPVDNIPLGDPSIERLPKKDARRDYEMAQKEMRATVTLKQLETWAAANANRIHSYPDDWNQIFRKLYVEHRDDLRAKQQEAA